MLPFCNLFTEWPSHIIFFMKLHNMQSTYELTAGVLLIDKFLLVNPDLVA